MILTVRSRSAVPIRSYIDGDIFEPETIKSMGIAFACVCHELGLRDKDDWFNRVIARAVIEKAKNGVHNPDDLVRAVLDGFRLAPPRRTSPTLADHPVELLKKLPAAPDSDFRVIVDSILKYHNQIVLSYNEICERVIVCREVIAHSREVLTRSTVGVRTEVGRPAVGPEPSLRSGTAARSPD